jgi:hypothetical protein
LFAGLNPSDVDNLPFLWHRGEDFKKRGGKSHEAVIPLIFRVATVEDVKGMAATKASRHLWLDKNKVRTSVRSIINKLFTD